MIHSAQSTASGRDRSHLGLLGSAAASLTLMAAARFFGPAYFYVTEREWQTALTTYWTNFEGRGLFDAPTPLMGPPWHLPMEFPLFQWLAAQITVPGLTIADAGRLLSLIFFLAAVFVFRGIALDLDLERRVANASGALVFCSPLFLAYAFSHTIESLALLLGLLTLWALVRWLREPNLTLLLVAITAGFAAALAKATTWAVFAAAMAGLSLWAVSAARRHGRSSWDTAVGAGLMIAIPLACGLAWVEWSDAVKAAHPLASELTSTALNTWSYGTLEQKFSLAGWASFILRSSLLVLGPVGLILAGPAIVGALRTHRLRPPFPVFLASTTGLLAGPVVFTNLYFLHDYYALAPGLFAILLFSAFFFSLRPRPWLLSLLVLSNLVTSGLYLGVKQANYDDPLSDGLVRVAAGLDEGETFVLFGAYLDARVPFETRRKALQTMATDPSDAELRRALDLMENQRVGLVMTRQERFLRAAGFAARRFGLDRRTRLAAGVWVFSSTQRRTHLDLRPLDLKHEVTSRLEGFAEFDDPGPLGLLLPAGPLAAPGIGLAARNNYYLFDVKRGLRVVHHRWNPAYR